MRTHIFTSQPKSCLYKATHYYCEISEEEKNYAIEQLSSALENMVDDRTLMMETRRYQRTRGIFDTLSVKTQLQELSWLQNVSTLYTVHP